MSVRLQLNTVPVFQFVSPDHTQQLAAIAKVVEKKRGEVILMHAETVPGIYIVGDGGAGVYPPGATRPLVTLQRGQSFGEMAFLEKTTASATIRAEAKTTKFIVMFQQDLARVADADPELGRALYKGIALTLSQKLRMTTDRVAAELTAGRRLLSEMSSSDDGTSSLATLADDVARQNEIVVGHLDAGARLADELVRRMPDKAASVGALQLKLGEAKQQCQQFYPQLARQIAAITGFVQTMETFILHSTRD